MRNFDYTKFADSLWDTQIVSYLSKIHEYKGRQDLFTGQKPVQLQRLAEIAMIQSTESSNKIEGIVTTDTRLKQLVEDKTAPRNRDEDEIIGYRNVLNTIHQSYEYIPLNKSYILQLHRDLLRPAGLSYAGKFKNVQNYIKEAGPDGTEVIRFTPLPPYETESAVEASCDSFNRAMALETVDPLILIPVFICDFLCIHPFNDGNGRMSRLLTILLLYQSGYKVGRYISIEKQIEKTKDVYYDALKKSGQGWNEGENDYTPFIKYMLSVILACYIDFEDRVNIAEAAGQAGRAYDIVKACVSGKAGIFSSSEIAEECPSIGRSSVLDSLKKLTEEGTVTKIGSGRNIRYVRNNAENVQKNREL